MEPKEDARIRGKVQGFESEPFSFDNERLWSSISFPAARRERSPLIYYAAASAALAWALVFIFQELSRRDQLQVRLSELELAIQSEITRVSLTAASTPTETPCEMPETIDIVAPPTRVIIRRASVRQSVAKETTAALQDVPPTVNTGTPAVEGTTTPPESVPVTTQPLAKPRVVLGSSFPDNTSSARGKQRLRLGLFREEELSTRPSTPLVTLAGVNNQ